MLAVSIEAAQAAWLGRRLIRWLTRLRVHPLATEIKARGGDPIEWGIHLEPRSGVIELLLQRRLTEVAQRVTLLRSIFVSRMAAVGISGAPSPLRVRGNLRHPALGVLDETEVAWDLARVGLEESVRSSDLDAIDAPPSSDSATGLTGLLIRTDTWDHSLAIANRFIPSLSRRYWDKGCRPPTGNASMSFLASTEQLISLVAAVLIHLTVVRVVRGLSIAVLFGMMLFAGHVLYTFPGRHFWLMLDLALLSAVGLMGVRLLFALERDEILSALWSTRPIRSA